ncbi:phosphatase PAP2 family protein [Mesobacillus maritimus]|uniref:Phosphatase PAP2 family protein n=1 Tax=Mesobacillus maritimus TaxID=1643336 RepID=A0ABS7K808_9BACI|nr:phosphatase PAP2 family protein [Mesobacillus maritimus]MBY0098409.1 phosphatase PAP2 family protein [Mesobacillus maritimus]
MIRTWLGVVFIIFIASFSSIAYLVEMEKLIHFDHHIISFVQGFEAEYLTAIMIFFSFIGDTVPVIVITLLSAFFLYRVLRHRREVLLLLSTMIGSTLLNVLLKYIFQRTRPDINQLVFEEGFSFPSGHSMAAFSLYGILTFLLWRHIKSRGGRGTLLIFNSLMILLIGLSRIYLGVHYPSDVIAAYAASGFWLFTVIWIYQWLQERRYKTAAAGT